MRVHSVQFCVAGPHFPGPKDTVARVVMFDGTEHYIKFGMDVSEKIMLTQLGRMFKKSKKKKGDEASW